MFIKWTQNCNDHYTKDTCSFFVWSDTFINIVYVPCIYFHIYIYLCHLKQCLRNRKIINLLTISALSVIQYNNQNPI